MTGPTLAYTTRATTASDNAVRTGTVMRVHADQAIAYVDVGGAILPLSYLDAAPRIQVGDTAVLLRQDASWLILGTLDKRGSRTVDNVVGSAAPAVTSGTNTQTPTGVLANLAGTGALTAGTITKRYPDTVLRPSIAITFFVTNAATSIVFGVLIDGVGYSVGGPAGALATSRSHYSSWTYTPALPVGTYDIQWQWRITGTGNGVRDTGDWLAWEVEEMSIQRVVP